MDLNGRDTYIPLTFLTVRQSDSEFPTENPMGIILIIHSVTFTMQWKMFVTIHEVLKIRFDTIDLKAWDKLS